MILYPWGLAHSMEHVNIVEEGRKEGAEVVNFPPLVPSPSSHSLALGRGPWERLVAEQECLLAGHS